jgi:hypothetical protein
MNMSQLSRSSLCVRYAARSCPRSTNGSLSFAGAQTMSALAHPYPGSQQSASVPSIRYFSDSAGEKQGLYDILAREHAEEIENNSAEIPSELKELKDQLASTSTSTSASAQGMKLEPVIKTETVPVPANPPTEQAEASIPTEAVSNVPNLRRTDPLYIAPLPPSPTPQVEDIPVTQEPRVEEPLATDVTNAADGDLARPSWEKRLSELADYHKLHGHCNVPQNYSENTQLGTWVTTQRNNYKLHREGKKSPMTPSRIHTLESFGFEWDSHGAAWEERLSELADYRKIHGHCNVPKLYSDNTKLGSWVAKQRTNYRLHEKGKTSPMTPSRIQALESFGFEWDSHGAAWEERLSELAGYLKIHGHCNVQCYSENIKLGRWVEKQRENYRLEQGGNTSPMTLTRIQKLESLGFRWDSRGTLWEDRLSELADYLKIHGHCNVPQNYSENTQLGNWVHKQRFQNKLHLEGKKSQMTTFRIHTLESLGFEWNSRIRTARAPPGKTI